MRTARLTWAFLQDASFTAATLQHPENVYANWKPEYELLVEEKGDKFLR